MSEWRATAVCFTLLSWALVWWLLFELWPEVRAARLRLRLWRMGNHAGIDPAMRELIETAARHGEEFRWLPLLLARPRNPASQAEEELAWEVVKHVAWGAPWLWPALWRAQSRRRWLGRALGLVSRFIGRPA